MGTTAAKLQAIISSKEDIRIAITEKGVDISQATALSEYPAKIAAITSGGETPGGGVPAWTAPDDWIQLGTPNDNEILLLASDIYLSNCFQVTCVGGYTIDWGDGITESFDSGTRCYHNYIEGTGRGCSRGYTTFKIRIYSQNGVSPITAFIVKGITNSIDTTANSAILWAKLGTRGLTTASGMFFDSFSYYTCAHLEKVTLPNELPNCVYFTDTFKNATALEEVDMPTLYSSNPISFKGTFERCYNLTHFDFKAESLQISTMELMFSYAGISDVVLPGTVLGCSSFKTMFSYTSIRTLVLPIIDTPTNLDFMFSNCFALNEVVFNSSWNNNISTQSQAFTSCAAIRELVDYPDLIPPALGGVSLFSNLTGATRMRMPSSSGSLVSAQLMFNNCRSVSTIVNFQPMPNTTNISSAFYNCYNLRNIDNLEHFGDTISAMDLNQTFNSCRALKSIICRSKSTVRFYLNGTSQNRAALESLLFTNPNPVSTWAGSSPHVDVQYANMDAAALNAMFTSIIATSASFSGKTVRVTGNPGAATCDTTIITNAGGSVVI